DMSTLTLHDALPISGADELPVTLELSRRFRNCVAQSAPSVESDVRPRLHSAFVASRWSVSLLLLVGLGLASFGACNIYNEALLEPDPRLDGGTAGGSGGNGGSGGVGGGGSGGSDCLAGDCWW